MKLQKRLYYLKKVSGEFVQHGENPVSSQIEYLQRDLDVLTGTLPKMEDAPACKPTSVPGFEFPLTEQEEIERLEAEVRNDPYVRCQYVGSIDIIMCMSSSFILHKQVNYLINKKPAPMNLIQFLPLVFSDEALIAYNYHGSHASGKSKHSMKAYTIFSECFLGEWIFS